MRKDTQEGYSHGSKFANTGQHVAVAVAVAVVKMARHNKSEVQTRHDEWLAATREEPLDPHQVIIDPHHHLWLRHPTRVVVGTFMAEELLQDVIESQHRVVSTVYMQSSSAGWRRAGGPEEYRCVGESEVMQGVATMAECGAYHQASSAPPRTAGASQTKPQPRIQVCAGIIATVTLHDSEEAAEDGFYSRVLQAHVHAARCFRGIRLYGGKAEQIPFSCRGFKQCMEALDDFGPVNQHHNSALPFFKMAQNLDLRCVFAIGSQHLAWVPVVPTKTRLESSRKTSNPHFIYRLVWECNGPETHPLDLTARHLCAELN